MRDLLRNETVQTIILMAVVIAGFVAFWLGLRFALRTDYPLLAVASGSMEDTLFRGDLIMVQGVVNACDIKAGYRDEEPGDIIVFHKPNDGGELIVHRAVEKKIETDGFCYFQTQGDASPGHNPDRWGWVNGTDVVGRHVGKVPWLGHVPLFMRETAFSFLSTPAGIILVILIIIGLVLLDYLPFWKKRPED